MPYSHGYFDVLDVGPRRTYVNRYVAGRYDLGYLEVGGRATYAVDDEEVIILRAIDAINGRHGY